MVQDSEFAQKLYYDYRRYLEPSLCKRKIKHDDIVPLIERLQDKNIFTVNKAGVSEEGRSINLITCGDGPVKVFLWSQMHGDESTATRALFDIINFLSAEDDFNNCRKKLIKKLKLFIMPMVNPDGAELFQRENFFNIDINRDAVRLQTAEGRILLETFLKIKPDFGFNLHDQDKIYTAGLTDKSAVMSLLAPAFNYKRDVNRTRSRAMKLIVKINDIISQFVPAHTAKYSDEFEPRSFGDNFQRLGTSTILIESGHWLNDDEKQFVRKLNFLGLMTAFKSIAERSYNKMDLPSYNSIPDNQKYMLDMVIRNVKYTDINKAYTLDIGITRKEKQIYETGESYYESKIEVMGDLSVFHGFEDYDFDGYTVFPGKLYDFEFGSLDEIKKNNFHDLYRQGYLFLKLRPPQNLKPTADVPVNIILSDGQVNLSHLKPGNPPDFYLVKNDEVRYVIINGFIYNLRSQKGEIKNGMIISGF